MERPWHGLPFNAKATDFSFVRVRLADGRFFRPTCRTIWKDECRIIASSLPGYELPADPKVRAGLEEKIGLYLSQKGIESFEMSVFPLEPIGQEPK